MRRKERAVTGLAAIAAILDDIHVCHLGLSDGEETYVVPVNFGYTLSKEGTLTLYFHGAPAGRKYSLLIQNGKAGFELDGRHALMVPEAKDNPCAYSFAYASVIGSGAVRLLTDLSEKKAALQSVMYHETGRNDFHFPDAAVSRTAVFALSAGWYTAKAHEAPVMPASMGRKEV